MTRTRPALVSVIIPFLNTERFIREAIESVFAQTYEEWELLLVDDGSTDGSSAIAQDYARKYRDKVRYLEHHAHQNRGMSASRNLGIAHARGEYIAFLDADDVWFSHKLGRQVMLLETQTDAGMLYGLSEWWYSWSGAPEDSQRDFVHDLGLAPNSLVQPPGLLFPFFIAQQAALPNPSNILVRRAVVDKVGGFENTFRGSYEDQVFIAKVCTTAPVLVSGECWDRYRQHPDSSEALVRSCGDPCAARLAFLNWLVAYLSAQGVKEPRLRCGLRSEIWVYRHPALHLFLQRVQDLLFRIGRRTIPAHLYDWLSACWHGREYIPPTGWVRIGDLRRKTPLSREFGYDRGQPIDRYYIEKFLADQRMDIRGRVLEIADDTYTRRFGGEHVIRSDILHVAPGELKTTITGDLASADHIPSDCFDCIILTQTLQFIFDVPAALKTIRRILRPGGVALATFPGISPISRYDMERWGHFWGFTSLSARRLFEQVFPPEQVEVRTYGNVLAASAFLFGMAAEELKQQEIEYFDPDYEVTIAVRAVK